MRLEKASRKAIEYACKVFHYAKTVPVNVAGYSVFNDAKEWCGVILFGSGATNNLADPYGLKQGQVVELVRMALNGKQGSTGKALSIALKLIRKDLPLVKLIISYADSEQGHFGTIYQATNWIYTNYSTDGVFLINGIKTHRRSLNSKYGTSSFEQLKKLGLNPIPVKTKPKWKYIYPLDKSLIPMCKAMAKPYPKKDICDNSINGNAPGFQSGEGVRGHLIAQ
jgi:hypothetical protein